jgi:hypothetical protein
MHSSITNEFTKCLMLCCVSTKVFASTIAIHGRSITRVYVQGSLVYYYIDDLTRVLAFHPSYSLSCSRLFCLFYLFISFILIQLLFCFLGIIEHGRQIGATSQRLVGGRIFIVERAVHRGHHRQSIRYIFIVTCRL